MGGVGCNDPLGLNHYCVGDNFVSRVFLMAFPETGPINGATVVLCSY